MKIDDVIDSGKDQFKTFMLSDEELSFLAKESYPLSYIKYIKNEDWYAQSLKQLPELKVLKKLKKSEKSSEYELYRDAAVNILKAIDATQI